jgi:hypothetical protein
MLHPAAQVNQFFCFLQNQLRKAPFVRVAEVQNTETPARSQASMANFDEIQPK